MHISRQFTHILLALCALMIASQMAFAADPGLVYPAGSELSDQKAGSVLVYNIYSSSISTPNLQNTRINITNSNQNSAAFVHLFFVDGSTCGVADSLICLTANQTMSFYASDFDPGVTGYIVAVATNGTTGCPVNFNFLIGSEYVKFASGHDARLNAEAIAAVADTPAACDANTVTATLAFDGVSYNRLPRVLAVDSIPDRASGNDTLLIVNRIGGSLLTSASVIGPVFGLLYDELERPASFNFSAFVCQFRSSLSNNFPRTTPRFETIIPAGASGWMKFWGTSDVGVLGSVINFNPNRGTSAQAFNGGSNLHKLTLSAAGSLTIPVFPPSC
ncbi:MAG: hypothetical protein U0Z53_17925 [Blastocatellia bacterium]